MPKGYWVVRVDIEKPDDYPRYVAANAAPIAAFGGRFVIRGGRSETPEGQHRARNVVVEFPSFQAACDCYHSEGYQAAVKLRQAAAQSDFLIIEGYDGPQPGE
jgi:uncharacterized protein (DUF1330 family)